MNVQQFGKLLSWGLSQGNKRPFHPSSFDKELIQLATLDSPTSRTGEYASGTQTIAHVLSMR